MATTLRGLRKGKKYDLVNQNFCYISYRLLTKCLAPESALKEPDENWNWDVIFAQVSGELHKEWYSDGEKDQEKIVVSSGESNLQADIEGPGTSNRITKERPYTAFNRFPV